MPCAPRRAAPFRSTRAFRAGAAWAAATVPRAKRCSGAGPERREDAPKAELRAKVLHCKIPRISAPGWDIHAAIFDKPLCLWMEVE